MNKIIYINVLILLAIAVISIPSLASSVTGINISTLPSADQNLPSSTLNILLANNNNVSLNVLAMPLPQGSTNPNFTPVYYMANGTTTTTPPYLQKNFKDPVTLEVRYLKSKGMNNSQIVGIMKAFNISYNPDTGDSVRSLPVPQDLRDLANQQLSLVDEQLYNNSSVNNQKNTVQTANKKPIDPEVSNGLWTSYTWGGFSYNMATGVMGVDTSGDYGPGGYPYCKGTNTQYVTTHTGLYPYYVYFNGAYQGSGHLATQHWNQVSQTKEIFNYAQSGAYYTLDASPTIFKQQYLIYGQNGQEYTTPWNNLLPTFNYPSDNPCQISLNYWIDPSSNTYTDQMQVTGSWT